MKWKTAIFFKSEADKDSTTKEDKLRDFLGIYQTEELAKAALLEIRRKLGK